MRREKRREGENGKREREEKNEKTSAREKTRREERENECERENEKSENEKTSARAKTRRARTRKRVRERKRPRRTANLYIKVNKRGEEAYYFVFKEKASLPLPHSGQKLPSVSLNNLDRRRCL
jgi:hypothetical protein